MSIHCPNWPRIRSTTTTTTTTTTWSYVMNNVYQINAPHYPLGNWIHHRNGLVFFMARPFKQIETFCDECASWCQTGWRSWHICTTSSCFRMSKRKFHWTHKSCWHIQRICWVVLKKNTKNSTSSGRLLVNAQNSFCKASSHVRVSHFMTLGHPQVDSNVCVNVNVNVVWIISRPSG